VTIRKVNVRDVPIQGLNWSLGPQEVEDPRMSRESVHEDGRVVNPTHRPSLSAGDISGKEPVPTLYEAGRPTWPFQTGAENSSLRVFAKK